VSKALQKSRQMTSAAFPLSTDPVTPSQKATRLVRQDFALGEAMLAVLNHLPEPVGRRQDKPGKFMSGREMLIKNK